MILLNNSIVKIVATAFFFCGSFNAMSQSSCANPTVVTCGATLTGESTIGQGDNMDYDGTCVALNPNNGEDMVYAITPPAGITEVHITIDNLNMNSGFPFTNFFETYMSTAAGCATTCIEHAQFTETGVVNGTTTNTATFPLGVTANGTTTWYIVIDEQLTGGDLISYDITFDCTTSGISIDTDGCGNDDGISSNDGNNNLWDGITADAAILNRCESGTFCTEFLVENTGWEWAMDVEINLGPCWDITSVGNLFPMSGAYYTAGNWVGSVDVPNNTLDWHFTNSSNPAWGDGAGPNQDCQLYAFCFDATILSSCLTEADLDFTITVTDDGIGGSGATVGSSFNYTTDLTLGPIAPIYTTCPANVNTGTDVGNCSAVVNSIAAIAVDDCSVASLTYVITGATTASSPGTGINDASGTTFNTGVSTVTYTATNDEGQSTDCAFTVTVADTENPSPICQNISVALDAAGNATITSAMIDNGSTDNCAVASINLDVTTFNCSNIGANTVNLTVLDAAGNSSSCAATVTITDPNVPTANAGNDDVICGNPPYPLGATSGGSATSGSWSSSLDGTFSSVTDPNATYTAGPLAIAAGSVTLTWTTDLSPCASASDDMILTINAGTVLNSINDYVTCDVDFTLLNTDITGTALTGGQAYYTASGGPSGTGVLIADGTVYTAPTNITIYIYDGVGACSSEESFNVIINSTPVIDIQADLIECDSVQLPAISGTNLTGNESFYDGAGGTGTAYSAGDWITSNMTIYIYDENGTTVICSDETSFQVTIAPGEDPSFTVTDFCEGSLNSANVTGLSGGSFTFSPDLGDGSSIDISTGEITNGIGGTTYNVQYATSTSTCADSLVLTVTVNAIPNGPTTSSNEVYCSTATPADMTASGSGIFTWYDDAMTVIGTGSAFTPYSTVGITNYYVTETLNGCEGSPSMVTITINDCELIIPTAITPGLSPHDVWEIVNLDSAYPDNTVNIYNRWGNIIFEKESNPADPYSLNPWDGTSNGEPLPVASYYYIILFNDGSGDAHKGTVTIIKK